jgi:hypothetical protein
MSKWSYIANWVIGLSAGLTLLIGGILAGSAVPSTQPDQPYFLSMVLSAIGWAGIAWAVLTLLRFVHRMWSALPGGAVSPQRAAGFLLIPVFNLYWMVRVFAGFARQANQALEARGETARLPLGLFAIFSESCALTLVGAAVTVAMPFSPAGRAVALATFACAAVSAILAVYVMAVAGDAIVVLEAARGREAAATAR